MQKVIKINDNQEPMIEYRIAYDTDTDQIRPAFESMFNEFNIRFSLWAKGHINSFTPGRLIDSESESGMYSIGRIQGDIVTLLINVATAGVFTVKFNIHDDEQTWTNTLNARVAEACSYVNGLYGPEEPLIQEQDEM